jgi:hypothetical protein
MKEFHTGVKTLVVLVFAALCFIAVSENSASAQSGRAPTSIQRRVDELNRQGEQYEREQLDADLKGRSDKPSDRKRAQAVVASVEQDFKELQAGYNQIVLAMAAKEGFNYESISDAISEIAKCSIRLKQNLKLPRPNEGQEKMVQLEAGSERIEDRLLTLRKHIYSFVTNPLFESQGVLNVEQAKTASQDLDKIIELSKNLKSNGDRLRELTRPAVNKAGPETKTKPANPD